MQFLGNHHKKYKRKGFNFQPKKGKHRERNLKKKSVEEKKEKQVGQKAYKMVDLNTNIFIISLNADEVNALGKRQRLDIFLKDKSSLYETHL